MKNIMIAAQDGGTQGWATLKASTWHLVFISMEEERVAVEEREAVEERG